MTTTDQPTTVEPRQHLTGDRRAALGRTMATEYRDGASVREVAEKHGRSYGATHAMLAEAGVAFRGRGGAHRARS